LPDDLTIEEPLEIRVGRRVLATTMRTPGHDEELAAGFLVSETVVRRREEIAKISTNRENTVVVDLAAGVKLKLNSIQRFGTISSSCGLCGKTSIEAIRQNFSRDTIDNVQDRHRNAAFSSGSIAGTAGRFHANGRDSCRWNFRC
jgi:FdhD protein